MCVCSQFECCGWDNYADWLNTTYFRNNTRFPDSCNCGDDDDDDEGSGSGDDDECISVPGVVNQTIYDTVSVRVCVCVCV